MFDSTKTYTLGEVYGPAMAVQTKEEADAFLADLLDYCEAREPRKKREEHRACVLSNIGYWTGYYDHETAARVMELFNCLHPIFGPARPTAEEALAKGISLTRSEEGEGER